jgi:hypothetical protein
VRYATVTEDTVKKAQKEFFLTDFDFFACRTLIE